MAETIDTPGPQTTEGDFNTRKRLFKPSLGVWSTIIAFIYFFLNCLLLPEGLQYTTLLTPLFLWWILKGYGKALSFGGDWGALPPGGPGTVGIFIAFLLVFILYADIHISVGVNPVFYFRSLFLAFCSFTFAIAVHHFLIQNNSPGKLFEQVALANLILIPVAIISLLIHPLNEYFWYYKPISPGVKAFPRLSMLTYEASYYAFLFTPVFLYFLISLLLNQCRRPVFAILAVAIPLALSLSFGGIAVMGFTLALVFLLQFRNILDTNRKRLWAIGIIAACLAIGFIILYVFPDNPVAKRLFNIFNNKDTSIRGRTYDSFVLAWEVASLKSQMWGVGFGQIKVLAHDIIINYYKYYEPHPVVRIPNSFAETLAMFGIVGSMLRLALEIFLFFRTKTYSNIYRTAVFCFVFIYQFTGSFMFNIAELTLWVLAFTEVFPQFDLVHLNSKKKSRKP